MVWYLSHALTLPKARFSDLSCDEQKCVATVHGAASETVAVYTVGDKAAILVRRGV